MERRSAGIARAIGPNLTTVFSLASDWKAETEIGAYLAAHKITIGVGLFDNPGLAFAGTPGMSVGRIRAEKTLALKAAALLAAQDEGMWALDRVETVRNALRKDPELADMLETGTAARPYAPPDTPALIGRLAASFLTTYLWPVGLAVVALGVIGAFFGHALGWLVVSAVLAFVGVLLALAIAYFELRSLEKRDSLQERTAAPATLAAMFQRENRQTQNHMISVTERKPGGIRWFTSRLVFWVIGELATYQYPPGFLSDIGTIHFARWVTPPGTRDVLFFSNFDDSWESYLEDFITKAHAGLTGVWSNSVGFPRTENLFQKGATDGERFKRYARQSMAPTRFWYSAYPNVTTSMIRANATIRLGLSGAMTEDEATRLARFVRLRRAAGGHARQQRDPEHHLRRPRLHALRRLPVLRIAGCRHGCARLAHGDHASRRVQRRAPAEGEGGCDAGAGSWRVGTPRAAGGRAEHVPLRVPHRNRPTSARGRMLGDTGQNAARTTGAGVKTAPHAVDAGLRHDCGGRGQSRDATLDCGGERRTTRSTALTAIPLKDRLSPTTGGSRSASPTASRNR